MRFLDRYSRFYLNEFYAWDYETNGIIIIVLTVAILSNPVVKIPYQISLLIGLFLAWWLLDHGSQKMFIARDGCTLLIENKSIGKRSPFPLTLLPSKLLIMVRRILGIGTPDKRFLDAKILACDILNRGSNKVYLHLYTPHPPIPPSQVIVTNHVDTPIRDAFSFFPFIRRDSEVLVVQHKFDNTIAYVSRYVYGAWTIDKDDKSEKGKRKLEQGLMNIISYVRNKITNHQPVTLVVYPMGKVPKTESEVRTPTKFYPGAFYLSLMLKLPVTPLVNYYGLEGDHHVLLLPSRDLNREYGDRITEWKYVGDFRKDENNKMVIEEIAESFRKQFLEVYNKKWKTSSEDLELVTVTDSRKTVIGVEEDLKPPL